MQLSVGTDLHYLYRQQQLAATERKLSAARSSASRSEEVAPLEQAAASCRETLERVESRSAAGRGNPEAQRWYKDFERELLCLADVRRTGSAGSGGGRHRHSALPALGGRAQAAGNHAQDVGRLRGVRQQFTASSIYALRSADTSKLYMVEGDQPLNAGEANMVSSELTHEGDLRVAFHRGRFPDDKTIRRAANNAALVINDIQADVIGSFRRPAASPAQPRLGQDRPANAGSG